MSYIAVELVWLVIQASFHMNGYYIICLGGRHKHTHTHIHMDFKPSMHDNTLVVVVTK